MIHFLIAIIVCILITIFYLEYKKWKIEQTLNGFINLKSLPILGIAHRFIGKSNDELPNVFNNFFIEACDKTFYCWFGPLLFFGVSEPETLRIVMTSDDCLNKPNLYEMMMCPTAIIATDKEIWRPDRRELNAAFNTKVLLSYLPLVNIKAKKLINCIEPMVNDEPDLYKFIFKCMIDTIAYTTMGTDIQLQTNHGEIAYNIIKNVMHNIQTRVVRIWLIVDFIYKLTPLSVAGQFFRNLGNTFFDNIRFEAQQKIEEIEKYDDDEYIERGRKQNNLNFMEKLLWCNRAGIFNENQLLDQMCVIYVAGVDTSTIAIFMTLLMLAIHPEYQKKVYDEIMEIVDDSVEEITYHHLIKLKQLDYVFKETLRLYPPAPIIVRTSTANVTVPQGVIPRGSLLIFNIKHLHTNKTIWGSDADTFDPTRFYPECCKDRPAFSYIPFSAGPRNCIGMKYAQMSTKIIIAHLLRQYEFSSNLRFEDVEVKYHLVMEISNKNALQIKKRNVN